MQGSSDLREIVGNRLLTAGHESGIMGRGKEQGERGKVKDKPEKRGKMENPKHETRNSEPVTRNPKPVTRNPKLVLGLVGSPRKMGNCEIFIKELSSYLSTPHELNLVRLPALNILPCRACYSCITGKPCPNEDDLEGLLAAIAGADAVVVASPVYFFGAHSIFKRILDRAFLFYNYLERTSGKPCILANIYGMNNGVGAGSHTLRTMATCLGLTITASANMKAALPGEIHLVRKNRERIKNLAELLFSGRAVVEPYGCPFCGSEIVRMDSKGLICALCHGRFRVDSKGMRVQVTKGVMLGTPEHILTHKASLRKMKERFLKTRKETLRALAPLKNIGEWI
jgi:NAD(P)H-dependent FMN reductase